MINHFSQKTIETLGYYVYVYSDPKDHTLPYNLFCEFKDGKLVYNSQVASESSEYNWEIQFAKAFSYAKLGE